MQAAKISNLWSGASANARLVGSSGSPEGTQWHCTDWKGKQLEEAGTLELVVNVCCAALAKLSGCGHHSVQGDPIYVMELLLSRLLWLPEQGQ
jgi:hypothetical protein